MSVSINARILRDLRSADRRERRRSGGALWASAHRVETNRVTAQWLAGDKSSKLGRRFTLTMPEPGRVEAFLPDGRIRQVRVHPPLDIDRTIPDGARYLRLTVGQASRDIKLATLAAPAVAASLISESRRFGPATATFVFPVFAECFPESGSFFGHVRNLYDWIVGDSGNPGIPPFNRADIKARFGLAAHFWPSQVNVGRFGTRVPRYDCQNHGNNAVALVPNNHAARAALKPLMLRETYGLVLINSGYRGGAGGMAQYGYPAWATTAACPGEDWRAIALHEIAHGLGLGDEYSHPWPDAKPPTTQPNIATSTDITKAPWRARLQNRPGETLVISQAAQAPMATNPPAASFVGLFQGAHYSSTKYYRPSFTCLMRATNVKRFCPVCFDAIVAKILSSSP